MKSKLFLFGLLSIFYVNSQVLRLVELPTITDTLEKLYSDSGVARTSFAPTNDECEGALEVTVNDSYECTNVTSATLFEATDSGIEAEAGTADDDVWFSFVATNPIHRITLENVEDDLDMVTEIFEGTCGDLVLVDHVDDPNVLTVAGLEVGNTYYVRVYSYTDTPQEATFDICIGTPPPPPANDECENAVALTVSPDDSCENIISGTLLSATDSGIETDDMGDADDDVWFSFTASAETHRIEVSNVDSNDDGFDLAMEVFEGDCGGAIIESSDPNILIATGLTPETIYYVRVYSYSDTPVDTTFDICVSLLSDPPANDECENAVELTVNTDYLCGTVTAGTLNGATNSGIPDETGIADDDVWFSFTATTAVHKIEVSNITTDDDFGSDLVIEVLGGCGGTIIESSDPNTVIVSGLTPETVYYVRVFSYFDYLVDTTFDICVGTPPVAPLNDECSAAVSLTASQTSTCVTPTSGTLQSSTNSGVPTTVGTADDDVWYWFVATSPSHLVALTNVEGNQTNLVFEVFVGDCDAQTSIKISDANAAILTDLVIGQNYYIRVYSFENNNNADTVFDICVATPGDAPANDECDAAVALTVNEGLECEAFTSGTLAFATDSGIPDETGTADDDVWYSFTATSDKHKITAFNIQGNTTDLVMEVFEGDCGGEIIESSDPQTFVLSGLSEGTVYYVRVFSYGTLLANTTFDICIVNLPSVATNDECEEAIALTVNTNGSCDVVTTATLANATDSGIDTEEGNPNDDVWFSFVATGTSHKVSITDSDDFETLLVEVFDGECGGLNLVSDPESSFVDNLTIGTTYYARVFSYYTTPVFTIFEICVTQRQDPPANDECAGAIALTVDAAFCDGVLNNGGNLGATASDEDLAECFDEAENDVWFSFTVPANVASVDISTDFAGGSLEDSVIALYSGTCGDLTEIDCDDDGGEETLSVLTNIDVNVGETYYVRVAGYSADDEGTFCLEISTNETLSTGDFTKNTLKAYPNPVKNFLNLSNPTAITDVAIFNLLGQQVIAKTVNANQGQVDMSHLASGAYLVKITADNAVQTIKIIKE